MKAILISIHPQWVAKILNGEKTIEIRKKFPKDYVGWVYIYCCAEDKNGYLIRNRSTKKMEYTYNGFVASICWLANRKVVARFWCDKVEEISYEYRCDFTSVYTDTLSTEELEMKACLTRQEFRKYLNGNLGCAIYITKLEIFDKPKEISEFKHDVKVECYNADIDYESVEIRQYPLTRAPQSWCYIEV